MRTVLVLLLSFLPAFAGAEAFHWARSAQTLTRAGLVGVGFSSSLTGFVAAQDGKVLRTLDGGKKWEVVHRGPPGWKRLLARGETVVAAGAGEVAASFDGGATFLESPLPSRITVQGVDLDGRGGIWVCGMAGKVYYSRDRGASWKEESPGRPEALYFVRSLASGLVIAGGQGGLWIRYPDGKWLPSRLKAGTIVQDVDVDARGETWMLTRVRENAAVLRCKDIARGCNRFSEDEAEYTRLVAGGDYLWLAGEGSSLNTMSTLTGILQPEKLPGYAGIIRASCIAPDGTVWAVGEKGSIFSGVPAPPPSTK
jgi:hypothetical protein